MTNKIGSGGIDNRPAPLGSDRTVKPTGNGTVSTVEVAAKPRSGVHITDSAKQLAALEQAIRNLPDVDEARVSQIRQAISDGTYEVSPDRIAERLIRIEQEMQSQ